MQSREMDKIDVGGDLAKNAQNFAAAQQEKVIGTLLNKDLLPSRGKYYTEDIRVKKLSIIDIKSLSMITQENVNNVINNVISKNVLGINTNDIFVGDKLWLIFYLRSITYNDFPFSVKYKCDTCNRSGVYQFRMKDVNINYLKDDFDNQFKMTNGDIVTLTFPTIGNENQAARLKKDDQFAEYDNELVDIANYIKAVNGNDLTLRDAYNYLENMDPQDFATFTNYMGNNTFGVKPTFEIQCSCGNIVDEKVVFTADFFMPDFNKK